MNTHSTIICPPKVWFAALAFAVTACSGGAKTRDQTSRPKGIDTVARQEPDRAPAVADYRRALDANGNDAVANRQLGAALVAHADLTQAYHYLLRAHALAPNDPDASLALGTFYLIDSKTDMAREQAHVVLDKDSTNVAGSILFAATSTSNDDITRSIQILGAAKPRFGNAALPRLALGTLMLQRGDVAGAERAFQEVAANEPKSAEVHSVLAAFFGAHGNSAMAAQELKTFNDLAATDSLARVRAATLYLLLNRREDAKRVLREGLDKGNVESPSSRLLAALALADGNQEDAGRALAALPKETSDVDELVLRARYHLLRSETNAAVQDLRRALRVAPKLAPIHYEMALSDLQQANATFSRSSVDTLLKDALAHLGMASKLAPDYPEAVLQLAAIKTQLGAPLDAISDLDHFARANPRSTKAKLALGATLVGSGRFPEASEAFQDVLRSDPTSAEAHYWLGTLLLRDRKVADARREFETAASISPSYSEPTTQLVVLDLADGKPDVAFSRVTRQIDRAPQSARLFDLLGLVSEARNNASAAEAAYLRALRLDNNLVDAHLRLAEIYRASGKLDQSVAQADETVRLSPKNVNALMAAGASHQAKGDAAAAHQAYARVLQVDARNLGAANNLAVLLSEQSGGLDSAVVLARLAHELAPNDPHVSDTLGWIMYKRGAYAEAAPLLKSSASQLPDSPSIQYHLGMTAHQLGDTAVARLALTKAVASGSNFAGREDARRALAQLK